MAAISAALVKELRERTGLGMLECKKALTDTDGDMDKAIEELRKKSGMKAAKKAGRTAAEGVVATKIAADGSYGMLIEVNSETDFAARDENLMAFVNKVLARAFELKSTDVAEVMNAEMDQARDGLVQKIGENVSVRRIVMLEGKVVAQYVHGNNRIGVLISLSGGDAELARDVAMHVAASNPQFVNQKDVSEALIAKEREIFIAQAAESGKPAEIIEKMVGGRISKFLAEISLVDQPFVKDPEIKVGALVKKAGADVTGMIRFEVGEGIEKEEVDFAAEVAKLQG